MVRPGAKSSKKARSFSGCKCCKQAKRKCPEERPRCSICEKLGLKCEYDLNFLFRCEMVDFEGHISKAQRITRPAQAKSDSYPHEDTPHDDRPAPQKYIHYEFIDESASLMMSPTISHDRSATPTPAPTDSPLPAFSLLLEAVNADSHKPYPSQDFPTPPESPDEVTMNPIEQIRKPQTLRGSLEFILN